MKINNLIKVSLALTICNFSFGQGFDMGGPPKKKTEKTRSEITSPNKHAYSEVQKKYQNQIVFSNDLIPNGEENPSAFIETWDLKDPLSFRVYMTNTIMEGVYDFAKNKGEKFDEYYFADFSILTVVSINGKEMATREKPFSTKKEMVTDWITYSGTIKNANGSNKTHGDLGNALKRAIHALGNDYKDGVLDVKFEMYAVSSAHDRASNQRPKSERSSLLSSGELKVKVTKEGMKEFAPILCYETLKNGGSMEDLNLEKMIMEKYHTSYGNVVTDANIISEDWNIIKNGLGVPLKRNLSANVTYIHDNKEYINEYFFNQTYAGNGYQKSINSSSVGDTRPYSPSCAAYKKELVK